MDSESAMKAKRLTNAVENDNMKGISCTSRRWIRERFGADTTEYVTASCASWDPRYFSHSRFQELGISYIVTSFLYVYIRAGSWTRFLSTLTFGARKKSRCWTSLFMKTTRRNSPFDEAWKYPDNYFLVKFHELKNSNHGLLSAHLENPTCHDSVACNTSSDKPSKTELPVIKKKGICVKFNDGESCRDTMKASSCLSMELHKCTISQYSRHVESILAVPLTVIHM